MRLGVALHDFEAQGRRSKSFYSVSHVLGVPCTIITCPLDHGSAWCTILNLLHHNTHWDSTMWVNLSLSTFQKKKKKPVTDREKVGTSVFQEQDWNT